MLGTTALCPFAPGVPVVVHAPVCVIAMGPRLASPCSPLPRKPGMEQSITYNREEKYHGPLNAVNAIAARVNNQIKMRKSAL